jgi:hypothetical protein
METVQSVDWRPSNSSPRANQASGSEAYGILRRTRACRDVYPVFGFHSEPKVLPDDSFGDIGSGSSLNFRYRSCIAREADANKSDNKAA